MLLEGRRLSKRFVADQQRLVDAVIDVDIGIESKETVALIGHSGSGKSTLVKLLLRLMDPDSGTVHFDGADITRYGDSALVGVRRRMQVVFQDPQSSLNPRMRIRDIVAEGARLHRVVPPTELDQHVATWLDRVGLSRELGQRIPHELSGGQRQRVAIARALAVGPEILIADEPLSALDASVQAQVLEVLIRLKTELSLSMLFVTHDLRIAERIADRTLTMQRGRIVSEERQ